jgi:two-component system, OmpR family, response regulator
VDTSNAHVLVVDEDTEVCGRVCEYLSQHRFRVTAASSGEQMLEIIGREAIDLLLLEPRLGGGEGIGLTRSIREIARFPIVVLSGLIEEADRVMGLELGADDYVTKPFSCRELLARIRALLRRSRLAVSASSGDRTVRAYRFGGWELNVKLHRLLSPAGKRVPISRGEFSLLCTFLSAPQQVMSRDRLLDLSRLHSTEVYDRTIDVQILRLRRKMEEDPARPRFIRTERGVGYFFDHPVAPFR